MTHCVANNQSKDKLFMCVRESVFHSKNMGLKVELCALHWNTEFMFIVFFMMCALVCM